MILNAVLIQKENQIIHIKIINPNNPLILYLLELSEIEFKLLIEEQKINVNFNDFPTFLINMTNLCSGNENSNYSGIIYLNESPEIIFVIEENSKNKINEYLKLKLRKANDEELKKYLSEIYLNLKKKFEEAFYNLNDLNSKNKNLSKENMIITEKIKDMEMNNKNKIDSLCNEKNKEINDIKESYINERENQMKLYEKENQDIKNKYENNIYILNNKINNLTENKRDLENKISELEINLKNYEGKFEKSNSNLNEKEKENELIIFDNKKLKDRIMILEKNLDELKCENNSLKNEIEESHKNNINSNIIIDSLNKRLESNDDNIKSLKVSNLKLKEKLDRCVEEIKKGNNIIEKLTNEIKNKKSKLKSAKQTLEARDELIKQHKIILEKQNKNLDDYKNDNENKNQKIEELKNKIENYTINLNENEKLLEEDKKMILYLNKNLTEITNFPFKSRFYRNNGNDIENHPPLNVYSSTFNSFNNTNNYDNNNNYLYDNENLNENKMNTLNNNIICENNNLQENIYYDNNYYNRDLNNINDEDAMIILPETNLCNYQVSGKLGNMMKQYMNKESNLEINKINKNNSLLDHKYGNFIIEPLANNEIKRNTYNIEEEFPKISK